MLVCVGLRERCKFLLTCLGGLKNTTKQALQLGLKLDQDQVFRFEAHTTWATAIHTVSSLEFHVKSNWKLEPSSKNWQTKWYGESNDIIVRSPFWIPFTIFQAQKCPYSYIFAGSNFITSVPLFVLGNLFSLYFFQMFEEELKWKHWRVDFFWDYESTLILFAYHLIHMKAQIRWRLWAKTYKHMQLIYSTWFGWNAASTDNLHSFIRPATM